MVLKKKYKGNTLPEVMVALTIISFCSVLAVTIYINIQQNTQPFIKMKANELALKYLKEAETKADYFDNTYKEEEYSIKKTITREQNFQDCVRLNITVYNSNNKKMTEVDKLIYDH